MQMESLDVIIYFPLGDELGKMFEFHLDKETAAEWIWEYWYDIYCKLDYLLPSDLIISYMDMLGTLSDEIYQALRQYVDPLDPIQVENAVHLLRIAIKHNQICRVCDKKVIVSRSVEDL